MVFVMTVYVIHDLVSFHLKIIFHIDQRTAQAIYDAKVKKNKDDRFHLDDFHFFLLPDNKFYVLWAEKPSFEWPDTYRSVLLTPFIHAPGPRAPPGA